MASVAVASALAGGVGAGTAAAQTTDLSSTIGFAGSADVVDAYTGNPVPPRYSSFKEGTIEEWVSLPIYFLLGGRPEWALCHLINTNCGQWVQNGGAG